MSYQWKPVEGQDWSNRARYHVYRLMRLRNLPASDKNVIPGVSPKTLYNFLVGDSDMTITRLGLIADACGVQMRTLFDPIPDNPRELPRPHRK
jgi:hypothetical protein